LAQNWRCRMHHWIKQAKNYRQSQEHFQTFTGWVHRSRKARKVIRVVSFNPIDFHPRRFSSKSHSSDHFPRPNWSQKILCATRACLWR
jgi:hypothetical protein